MNYKYQCEHFYLKKYICMGICVYIYVYMHTRGSVKMAHAFLCSVGQNAKRYSSGNKQWLDLGL